MALTETITIGANTAHPLTVSRLGYGTMRLTGEGIWGDPPNRPEALEVLKTAVASGVNFLDTADYYGEDITNKLIKEALYPYADNLVICTKVGATRKPDKSWVPFNTPENLRTSIENNLRTLQIEQVQLVHLRMMPHRQASYEEQLDAMFALQQEGKILHIGLSNVTREELEMGLQRGPIASVENMYGYHQRGTLIEAHGETHGGGEVLDVCEQHQIPLIPFFSLHTALPKSGEDKLSELAEKHGVTPAQMNIAWLLHKSPWILPIPGTSKVSHLKENIAAADIKLMMEDLAHLD